MRVFLDSNVLTYIAFFEDYLIEGHSVLPDALRRWELLQGAPLTQALLVEVYALRILYLYDDFMHLDWLFSDISWEEISHIRERLKRESHHNLLERLHEHRRDVYDEELRVLSTETRDARANGWKHLIPEKMLDDARLLAEAELVEADYFLTCDADFIKKAELLGAATMVMRPTKVPFVAAHL